MLILERTASDGIYDTIHIGDDTTVTVLSVRGRVVKIGVDAPKNVAVHRAEVYQRIKREKREVVPA